MGLQISLKTRLKIPTGAIDAELDALLNELLDEAKAFILGYTRRNENQWKPVFDNVQLNVAAINYGRLGAEGTQTRTEGDVSNSFYVLGADYPDSVIKTLNQYRLIKGV